MVSYKALNTHTEIKYNKMYPAFGKSTDKEFEDWRKE